MPVITCENCSHQYQDSSAFCPSCGQANRFYVKPKTVVPSRPSPSPHQDSYQSSSTPQYSNTPAEGDTTIYAVIGFFFWFVGIILYLALKESRPKAAQSALNGSLTIIILAIVIVVLASI